MYYEILSIDFMLLTGKDKNKKSNASTNTLAPTIKQEHALVGQAVLDIIGARLSPEVCIRLPYCRN